MNQLFDHNQNLKSLYTSYANSSTDLKELKYDTSLDRIDRVLRDVLSIQDMRLAGSFFTGDELAQDLVAGFTTSISDSSVILDPTCGAGNLLIACSRQLSISKSLEITLRRWGKALRGYDLYPSFVEATKLRIILEAIDRGCKADCSLEKALMLLSNINTADAMSLNPDDLSEITHAIMNPPFSTWESPKRDFWKKGKVNAAAVVLEHYFRVLPQGTEISAIVPEVLRSGSRYDMWREFTESCISASVKIIGRFNSKTDVDVFTLQGRILESHGFIDWKISSYSNESTISDFFEVSVGRLVAYRDPEEGTEYPYIHPKNVPLWSTVSDFPERRRFKGTTINPPFVVLRRNSRPNDKYRAAGAIIIGKEPVAVENHLVIIKPIKETISECRKLLKHLKTKKINDFLNTRIRCRHLTVGAVKQIPYS